MSDTPKYYTLRNPLILDDIVYNDMGEPPAYLFKRDDASEHEIVSCNGDYVKQVFVPLDVDMLRQQIDRLIDEVIDKTGEGFNGEYGMNQGDRIEIQGEITEQILSLVFPGIESETTSELY